MQKTKTAPNFISSKDMRMLEVNAEYFGVSLLQLMENAGRNVSDEIASRFDNKKKVAIFCGLGGNGGDGFVAARHLTALGFSVTVFLAGKGRDITHEASLKNWEALKFLPTIVVYEEAGGSTAPTVEADIVVDALLGTGTKGKLKPPISALVKKINSCAGFKLSVDVPTGIDADTGDVLGEAVQADLTVTFYKAKQGLQNAPKYSGEIAVKQIGLPSELELFIGPGDVYAATPARAPSAHKGDFGRLLVVGGSKIFSGAPALVAMSALRTGADLAYVASPEKTAHDIASLSPDLITIKLEGDNLQEANVDQLAEYLAVADAVALGPGAGLQPETKKFMKAFIADVEESGKPLLLDADGLKAFAEFKRRLKIPLVLTPHAGEYAILSGKKLPDQLNKKAELICQTALELGAVLLVKGQVDIVTDGKKLKLNYTGNAGMTVGGTGDVLSGLVAALLAQKVDPFEAAAAGAFVNGAAGDFAAANVGFHMVASDLLNYIPQVLDNPMSHLKVRKASARSV